MRRFFLSFGVALVCLLGVAQAFPDGAPWGSADPASPNNCASCHFDGEVQINSPAISLWLGDAPVGRGQKTPILLGTTNRIQLRFKSSTHNSAGFLITASSGIFESPTSDMEATGRQLRSIEPKEVPVVEGKNAGLESNIISWEFDWFVPPNPDGDFVFSITVNENNGDDSAFGDVIHFKTVLWTRPGDFSYVPPN